MSTLVLIPVTDHATEDEILSDWNAGKDFIIRTMGVRGTYASIRDMDNIKPIFDLVYIRYNSLFNVAVVYERERNGQLCGYSKPIWMGAMPNPNGKRKRAR